MTSALKIAAFSTLSALTLAACSNNANETAAATAVEPLIESLAPPEWNAGASAKFIDREGADAGYTVLADAPNGGVLMRIDLGGLSQGWHAIHLHQIGDCSDIAEGFKASGGHINPDGLAHGLLNPDGPERADIPNIYAGADGRATAEIFSQMVALFPSEAAEASDAHPIIDEDGFAIVVHANQDDHLTQPIGGAGPRVACAAVAGE